MTDNTHSKLLILGSGPAGYTAAIYASRAMLEPTLLTGIEPGGQMTITTDVENYPGFADIIQGPWLMDQMKEQAISVGTNIVFDTIVDVDLSNKPFKLKSDSEKEYTCDALIIATGAQANWLGLESENKFKGYGVSACATCDGFFYKEKKVVVVGGGDSAMEEATFLTKFASQVILIHRRSEFRASKIMVERTLSNPKVKVVYNATIDEILGSKDKGVNAVIVNDTITGEKRKIFCEGVFMAIGHTPNTQLFEGTLELDEGGYIITKPDSTYTNIDGIFACGDVQDHVYRQAVTAAGSGCMAAIDAERWLDK